MLSQPPICGGISVLTDSVQGAIFIMAMENENNRGRWLEKYRRWSASTVESVMIEMRPKKFLRHSGIYGYMDIVKDMAI